MDSNEPFAGLLGAGNPLSTDALAAPSPTQPRKRILFSPLTNQLSANGAVFAADDATSALEAKQFLEKAPNAYEPDPGIASDWVEVGADFFDRYINNIEDPSLTRLASKNVGIGVDNLQLMAGRGLQFLGAEETGQRIVDNNEADLYKTQPYNRRFSELGDGDTVTEWFVANFAQQVPNLLALIGTSLGGFIAGPVAATTTAGGAALRGAGAIVRLFGNKAFQGTVSGAVKKKVAGQAISKMEANALRMAGATAAAVGYEYAFGVADTYGELRDTGSGADDIKSRLVSAVSGIPYAALSIAPEGILLGRILGTGAKKAVHSSSSQSRLGRALNGPDPIARPPAGATREQIWKYRGRKALEYGRRGAVGFGVGGVLEGLSEAGQEGLLIGAGKLVNDHDYSDEAVARFIDTFAAGFGVGGPLAGIANLRSNKTPVDLLNTSGPTLPTSEPESEGAIQPEPEPTVQPDGPPIVVPPTSDQSEHNQRTLNRLRVSGTDDEKVIARKINNALNSLSKNKTSDKSIAFATAFMEEGANSLDIIADFMARPDDNIQWDHHLDRINGIVDLFGKRAATIIQSQQLKAGKAQVAEDEESNAATAIRSAIEESDAAAAQEVDKHQHYESIPPGAVDAFVPPVQDNQANKGAISELVNAYDAGQPPPASSAPAVPAPPVNGAKGDSLRGKGTKKKVSGKRNDQEQTSSSVAGEEQARNIREAGTNKRSKSSARPAGQSETSAPSAETATGKGSNKEVAEKAPVQKDRKEPNKVKKREHSTYKDAWNAIRPYSTGYTSATGVTLATTAGNWANLPENYKAEWKAIYNDKDKYPNESLEKEAKDLYKTYRGGQDPNIAKVSEAVRDLDMLLEKPDPLSNDQLVDLTASIMEFYFHTGTTTDATKLNQVKLAKEVGRYMRALLTSTASVNQKVASDIKSVFITSATTQANRTGGLSIGLLNGRWFELAKVIGVIDADPNSPQNLITGKITNWKERTDHEEKVKKSLKWITDKSSTKVKNSLDKKQQSDRNSVELADLINQQRSGEATSTQDMKKLFDDGVKIDTVVSPGKGEGMFATKHISDFTKMTGGKRHLNIINNHLYPGHVTKDDIGKSAAGFKSVTPNSADASTQAEYDPGSIPADDVAGEWLNDLELAENVRNLEEYEPTDDFIDDLRTIIEEVSNETKFSLGDIQKLPTTAADVQESLGDSFSDAQAAAMAESNQAVITLATILNSLKKPDGKPYIPQNIKTSKQVSEIAKAYFESFTFDRDVIHATNDGVKKYFDALVSRSEAAAVADENALALLEIYEAGHQDSAIEQQVTEVNSLRKQSTQRLQEYLAGNDAINHVNKAILIRLATSYTVKKQNDGSLKIVVIAKDNTHDIADIVGGIAPIVVNHIHEGQKPKVALLKGYEHILALAKEEYKGKEREGWVTFKKTDSFEEAQKLTHACMGTNAWCTYTGGAGVAQHQLSNGDFHIYYENNEPEIAIRMKNDYVEELAGRHNGSAQAIVDDRLYDVAMAKMDKEKIDGSGFVDDQKYRQRMRKFLDGEITREAFLKDAYVDVTYKVTGVDTVDGVTSKTIGKYTFLALFYKRQIGHVGKQISKKTFAKLKKAVGEIDVTDEPSKYFNNIGRLTVESGTYKDVAAHTIALYGDANVTVKKGYDVSLISSPRPPSGTDRFSGEITAGTVHTVHINGGKISADTVATLHLKGTASAKVGTVTELDTSSLARIVVDGVIGSAKVNSGHVIADYVEVAEVLGGKLTADHVESANVYSKALWDNYSVSGEEDKSATNRSIDALGLPGELTARVIDNLLNVGRGSKVVAKKINSIGEISLEANVIVSGKHHHTPKLVKLAAEVREIATQILPRNTRLFFEHSAKHGTLQPNDHPNDPLGIYETGDGMYTMRRILIALTNNPDPINTIHHETVHDLEAQGLFGSDWQVLVAEAIKNDWIGKHNIKQKYADIYNPGGFSSDLRAIFIEEAIAHEYAEWAAGRHAKSRSNLVVKLFERIKAFLKQVVALLKRENVTPSNVHAIFKDIESGVIRDRLDYHNPLNTNYDYFRQSLPAPISSIVGGKYDPSKDPRLKGKLDPIVLGKDGKPLKQPRPSFDISVMDAIFYTDDGVEIEGLIPPKQALLLVNKFKAKLKLKPKISIFLDQAELKKADPKLYARAVAGRPDKEFDSKHIGGYSIGDQVIIFRKFIHTKRELMAVLAHETMGHFGMRAFLPNAELNTILERIYVEDAHVRSEANRYAESYNVSRLEAIEEVLANNAASLNESTILRIWHAIKNALNKLGIKFQDDFARYFISRARKNVLHGDRGVYSPSTIASNMAQLNDQYEQGRYSLEHDRDDIASNAFAANAFNQANGLTDAFDDLKNLNVKSLMDRINSSVDGGKATIAKVLEQIQTFNNVSTRSEGQREIFRIWQNQVNKTRQFLTTLSDMATFSNKAWEGPTNADKKIVSEMLAFGALYKRAQVSDEDIKNATDLLMETADGSLMRNDESIAEAIAIGTVSLETFNKGFHIKDSLGKEHFYQQEITKDSKVWQMYQEQRNAANEAALIVLESNLMPNIERAEDALKHFQEAVGWEHFGDFSSLDIAAIEKGLHTTITDRADFEESVGNAITQIKDIYFEAKRQSIDDNLFIDSEKSQLANTFLAAANRALTNKRKITDWETNDAAEDTALLQERRFKDILPALKGLHALKMTEATAYDITNKIRELFNYQFQSINAEFYAKRTIMGSYVSFVRKGKHQVMLKAFNKQGNPVMLAEDYQDVMPFYQTDSRAEADTISKQLLELFNKDDKTYKVINNDNETVTVHLRPTRTDASEGPPLTDTVNYDQFVDVLAHLNVKLSVADHENIVKGLATAHSLARKHLIRTGTPGWEKDILRTHAQWLETSVNIAGKNFFRYKINSIMKKDSLWRGDRKRLDGLHAAIGRATNPHNKQMAQQAYDRYAYKYMHMADAQYAGHQTIELGGRQRKLLGRGENYRENAKKLIQFYKDARSIDVGPENLLSGELASKLKLFTVLAMLGGVVASAVINVSGILFNTVPALATYNSNRGYGGGFGLGKAMAEIYKASRDLKNNKFETATKIKAMINDGSYKNYGLTMDEADFLLLETEIGALSAAQTIALLGQARGGVHNNKAAAAIRGWMYMFTYTEQFNRRVTALSAYRLFHNRGMAGGLNEAEARLYATKEANDAVISTQGEYALYNRPPLGRGDITQYPYMFQQFTVTSIENLWAMNYKGRLAFLGALLLLAGIKGLPFADDILDLLDTLLQIFGIKKSSVERELITIFDAIAPGWSLIIMRGWLDMTGATISTRLGFGNIIPLTGIGRASTDPWGDAWRDVKNFLGPVFSSTVGAIATTGDLLKYGAEVAGIREDTSSLSTIMRNSPVSGIRSIFDGIQIAQDGRMINQNGRVVAPNVSKYVALTRALGFYPAVATRSNDIVRLSKYAFAYTQDMKTAFIQDYIRAKRANDYKAIQRIKKTIRAWNKQSKGTVFEMPNFFASANKAYIAANQPTVERYKKSTPLRIRKDYQRLLDMYGLDNLEAY